jgi:DNA repair protein RadA/Sms
MPKAEVTFACKACGAVFPRWLGRCAQCGEWESLEEKKSTKGRSSIATAAQKPVRLGEVSADGNDRVATGIGELDRVLGGGAVLGGVVLVGGDPGIGKSTLLLQALAGLAARGHPALYVSGEESAGQTASRAKRLGAASDDLFVVSETDLDAVDAAIAELSPHAVVIDSVQMMRSPSIDGAAGTITQLREACARLSARAKQGGAATFLVGHVTKDGMLAGPKVLEHMVDTVLWFEGERGHSLRTLRAHKNRFGSATEVGVFEMTSSGLREVDSPSALLLAERPARAPGSVVAATSEGTRPLLVEVQALVGPGAHGSGRRSTTGVGNDRLAMIIAVLERKVGLQIGSADVFVNIAGGVRVDEPAIDLPVALAIASSLRDRPVDPCVIAFGEIGLAGEVRRVPRSQQRLAEAAALGFERAIAPPHTEKHARIDVVAARTLAEAIEATLGS